MSNSCTHLDRIADVQPDSDGCADCLRNGGHWVHLLDELAFSVDVTPTFEHP